MSNESRQKVFNAAREFSATATDETLDTLRDALKEHDAEAKPKRSSSSKTETTSKDQAPA